jgi:hypothetical protein
MCERFWTLPLILHFAERWMLAVLTLIQGIGRRDTTLAMLGVM